MPTTAMTAEQQTLQIHRPDQSYGVRFCLGCLNLWGVGIRWPCAPAQVALMAEEDH